MNALRVLVIGTVVIVAATIATVHLQEPSPGPLSAAHAQEPSLLGGDGCAWCHGEEAGTMRDACATCHQRVHEQIASAAGLHGQLAPDVADQCDRCHGEHNGRDFRMTGPRSFRLAGIADPTAYDHAGLDFGLHGRHGEVGCEACHEFAEHALLPKGETRFGDLSQGCETCHDDPHGGDLPDCESCHGQEHPFDTVAHFTHTEDFPLVGNHAGLSCRECHDPASPFGIERLAQAGGRPGRRDCGDCHSSDHSTGFLGAAAAHQGVTAAATCAACHDEHDESFAWPIARMTEPDHTALSFALETPHENLECAQCHEGIGSGHGTATATTDPEAYRDRYPGRTPDACSACHQDPHGRQFSSAPAIDSCLSCHEPHRFAPSAFSIERHAQTPFPLDGSHSAVACNRCHEMSGAPDDPAAFRIFRGTPSRCANCHEDVHGGTFDLAGRPLEVHGRVGCARCHDTDRFAAVDHPSFGHAVWTGWELRGAHARVACEDCHPRRPHDRFPSREFGVAPTRCHDCHADPHAGQFAEGNTTTCASCHTDADSFRELTFDHERDSKFALGNNHRHLDCATCHRVYPTADGGSVVRYKPLGTECVDCHGEQVPPDRDRGGR